MRYLVIPRVICVLQAHTRGGSYACLSCVRVLAVVFLLEELNSVLGI